MSDAGWEMEPRGKGGVSCLLADKIDVDDFPFAVYAPAPPFAFGELVALVAAGEKAEERARLIVRSVNLHDELMAAVRAARHYINEAAQDPLNVPAANKLDAQLASVLKKAEEQRT